MKRIIFIIISILIILSPGLRADEGMWLLPLLEKLNIGTMTEMGLTLTAEDIYSVNNSSLKDAIVIFGGGCTGEIVSDKGLLLTNHHCGYGSIQSHSTTEHDYLEDGFWAGSLEEELPNPRLSVTFLIRLEDVTAEVTEALGDLGPEERQVKFREVNEQISSRETEGTHYTATVRPFFGSNQFFVLVYEVYRDVRLVGAPPSSIGKFGHDTDNWMWPRHTGDFSVFRVYMSPDGKPAEYSPDNVPYKPKHYLPVSIKGFDKGDFAMIMGYPGGTQRYMTSYEIDEIQQIQHPNRIKIRGARQEIIWADMMADEKVRIQYASKYSGSSNYWKFSIGQSQGLERLKIKEKKLKQEQEFTNWVAGDPERKTNYGNALELIKTAVEARADQTHVIQYLQECFLRGSEIISFATQAQSLYEALEGDDREKITDEAEGLRRAAGRFFPDYNAPTDRKVIKVMVKMFMEDIKPEYQPGYLKDVRGKYKGNYDKFVDVMFDKSVFADETRLNAFLDNPSKKVLDKDPSFQAAVSINSLYRDLQQQVMPYAIQLAQGSKKYIAGIMEMHPEKTFYPDANFTMRLTYGKVNDYYPRDAVHYSHTTTLTGVMEKEDPENYEFIVDPKLKELYKSKDFGRYGEDGKMIVCFTTDNDITGGNSGSPVINGNGELIGLAFDGNWEAMSGDIVFEPELQRCINVDIRYVLFIMDKFAGATNLIDEMMIVE
ncbi:MAG: peptidase S46 [Bacteroides sp. SM23_62_1]|nr:MAG: peptidase S46 [Bacteroides sp. SM23_62_1]